MRKLTSNQAARVLKDLEIVRRLRDAEEAPAEGVRAKVAYVKDVWKSGILYQHAVVDTDRGPAVIETMSACYHNPRYESFEPGSIIITGWARGAERFIKSIGWVRVGDVVLLTR